MNHYEDVSEGNRLVNAKINFVSYVDRAANQKTFLFTKSEGKPNVNKQVSLFVKSNEERLVYGIVYEPNTVDAHGDYMTAEDIEKAAHYFMQEARKIDKQHNYQSGYGEVVESYVAPANFEMGGQTVKKGSWVLVTKASEAVWKDIKAGKITGYSMAGQAERLEKSEGNDIELDITAEDLREVVQEALRPIAERITSLEVGEGTPVEKETVTAKEQFDLVYTAQKRNTLAIGQLLLNSLEGEN